MNILSVPCQPKNTLINTDEIVRLEGSGNYTIFHMVDGRHLLTSKSLIYFEGRLPFSFIRTHKSSLINSCYALQCKTADSVSMADGVDVPVARRRKTEVKKHLKGLSKSGK